MRRTGNKDENKRILMDLDVVLKSHDCPYIIQCYGAIVTNVSVKSPLFIYRFILYRLFQRSYANRIQFCCSDKTTVNSHYSIEVASVLIHFGSVTV